MIPNVNIFGQRICDKNGCIAWYDYEAYDGDDYGGFCEAGLDFLGRVSVGTKEVMYGPCCKLPIEFGIVRSKDDDIKFDDKEKVSR